MVIDLVSENVEKGTAQVALVYEGQTSVTRHIKFRERRVNINLRVDGDVAVAIYTDAAGVKFFRVRDTFRMESQ